MSSKAILNSVTLGNFDVINTAVIADNRVREIRRNAPSCDEVPSSDKITLKTGDSSEPIDIKNAMISIKGNIKSATAVTSLEEMCFYNIFDNAELRIGTFVVERVDNFATTMKMRRIMEEDSYQLNNGSLDAGGVFLYNNENVRGNATANGTFNKTSYAHLIRADKTFEIIWKLSDIFYSVRTLDCVYKRVNWTIVLNRRSNSDIRITGISDQADLSTDTGIDQFNLTQIQLLYDSVFLENSLVSALNEQYSSKIIIPLSKYTSKDESCAAGTMYYNKTLTLNTSEYGNICLAFSFKREWTPLEENRKYIFPNSFILPRIKKISLTYAGNVAYFEDDVSSTSADAGDNLDLANITTDTPRFQRFYDNFRKSKNLMISDESQSISYNQWLQYPIFCVPLINYAPPTQNGTQNLLMSIEFEQPIVKSMKITYMLLSDHTISLDPEKMVVISEKI